LIGNDVADGAAIDCSYRDNTRLYWCKVSTDDALEISSEINKNFSMF
jgi:hypothetical protein